MFVPVVKFAIVRIILTLTTHLNYKIEEMDLKTAILSLDFKQVVHVTIHDGFEKFHSGNNLAKWIFSLLKMLYSL
jgi:hypothetical protein